MLTTHVQGLGRAVKRVQAVDDERRRAARDAAEAKSKVPPVEQELPQAACDDDDDAEDVWAAEAGRDSAGDTAASDDDAEMPGDHVQGSDDEVGGAASASLLAQVCEIERLMTTHGSSTLLRLRALRELLQVADARLAAVEEEHVVAHTKRGKKRVLDSEFLVPPFSAWRTQDVRCVRVLLRAWVKQAYFVHAGCLAEAQEVVGSDWPERQHRARQQHESWPCTGPRRLHHPGLDDESILSPARRCGACAE